MAERKRRWIGLAATAIIAAALVNFLWVNTNPYTPQDAQRLYEHHQTAYDTVGEALLRDGEGRYWASMPEDFPEEIFWELDEALRAGRGVADGVWCTEIGIHNTPAVLFSLHEEEFPSGDGVKGLRDQYLAYIPEADRLAFSNENTEQVTPLTENWYLYVEIIP